MRLIRRINFLVALMFTASCCVAYSADSELASSALVDSVERQDKKTVRTLLDQNVDVNVAQVDGMTALHWAVYWDDIDTTKAIIEAGADVQCKNRYRVTPLSLACTNGNNRLVQLLLEKGADPNSTLPYGETVLMTAARTGRVGPVVSLLDKGAKVNAKENSDQTAVMWASAEGHSRVVEVLIKAGADFRTPLSSGFAPLMFAVREGHVEVANLLLLFGADVNEAMQPTESTGAKRPRKGMTPLLLAIENGHFELAVKLLVAGADPNESRTGFTPLHTLTWVRKPDFGDNEAGNPPPIGSGNLTSLQFARILVEHGADVNLRKKNGSGGRGRSGKKGTTAFMCAAGTADVAFLKLLVELGADPTIPNESNCTPLMMAAGIGAGSSGDDAGSELEALESVKYLLQLGADINAVDDSRETVMHAAAYKSYPKVVKFLADSGADIKVWSRKSKAGRTPLSIAQGYRPGNFKPSFETANAIKKVMIAQGVTPPAPPKKRESNYRD